MEKLILIGSGGHSKVVKNIIDLQGLYIIDRTVEFVDTNLNPELQNLDFLKLFNAKVFVAIGDNWVRKEVSEWIKRNFPQLEFINLIHPSAVVADGIIMGLGNLILSGSVVGASCKLNDGVILNNLSNLDHDSEMLDYSSLGPGAICGGNVMIGTCSAICLGAKVIQKVRIGDYSVIGAGSLVLEDIPNSVLAFGLPCYIKRYRDKNETYI